MRKKKENVENKNNVNYKTEIAKINSISELPLDKQIEIINQDNNISAQLKRVLIETAKEEEKQEKELLNLNRFNVLKRRAVRMFLTGQYTTNQIAKTLMISPNTLRNWLKDPNIKELITTYQNTEDDICQASLRALRNKALAKASEILDMKGNAVAKTAIIKDILDRTGHMPVQKQQVEVNMSYEERLTQVLENADYEVHEDE